MKETELCNIIDCAVLGVKSLIESMQVKHAKKNFNSVYHLNILLQKKTLEVYKINMQEPSGYCKVTRTVLYVTVLYCTVQIGNKTRDIRG